jgi:hypothetical protein
MHHVGSHQKLTCLEDFRFRKLKRRVLVKGNFISIFVSIIHIQVLVVILTSATLELRLRPDEQ